MRNRATDRILAQAHKLPKLPITQKLAELQRRLAKVNAQIAACKASSDNEALIEALEVKIRAIEE